MKRILKNLYATGGATLILSTLTFCPKDTQDDPVSTNLSALLLVNQQQQAAPPTGKCRTYPTSVTVTATPAMAGFPATTTQSFDPATKRLTSGAGGYTAYNSVADFVDETSVIPPVTKAASGADSTGVSTTTYTYDGAGRLTDETTSDPIITSAFTYTAWDGAGRPTAGSWIMTIKATAGTCGNALTMTYNNASRQSVMNYAALAGYTTCFSGGVTTGSSIVDYDANGNTTKVVSTANTVVIGTMTYTTNSTSTVCK